MRLFTRAAATLAALVALALSPIATAQSDTVPTLPVVDLNVQVPAIQVGDVIVVGPSEATAQLTIDTNGLATTVFVEYGTNGVLDQRTPVVLLQAGLDLANVLVQLLGLDPGTVIEYRIVAENSAGTTTSPTGTITTPPASGGTGSATFVLVDLATGNVVSGASAARQEDGALHDRRHRSCQQPARHPEEGRHLRPRRQRPDPRPRRQRRRHRRPGSGHRQRQQRQGPPLRQRRQRQAGLARQEDRRAAQRWLRS